MRRITSTCWPRSGIRSDGRGRDGAVLSRRTREEGMKQARETASADALDVVALACKTVSAIDARRLLTLVDALVASSGDDYRRHDILGLIDGRDVGHAFTVIVLQINRLARQLATGSDATTRSDAIRALLNIGERLRMILLSSEPSQVPPPQPARPMTLEASIVKIYELTVGRTPRQVEIETWLENLRHGLPFHEFVLLMSRSPEASSDSSRIPLLVDRSDGEFVQCAHEHTQNRGAGGSEINHWLQLMEVEHLSRSSVLSKLFTSGVAWSTAQEAALPHDGLTCRIMGTSNDLSAAQWQAQAAKLREVPAEPPATDQDRYHARFHIKNEPQVLVSVLTSLYRGGDFIEQFLDNISGQDIFDDYCELIIVDADSPEDEASTIQRYVAKHPNIRYMRMNYRIGIYDAWNVAGQAARGAYLTNANLDDLRRSDSFSLQAATLDNLPFVDVVYQDLYYTFDPSLTFDQIAAFGHQTNLPIVTLHNLVEFNSPHNAPMWRRSLHDELGWFDTHLKSAGDYEFWFRCLAAGKTFYKINDPHVVYYQNPKGLSTRPGSRGLFEALDVHKRYCRKLMPQEVTMSNADFRTHLAPENAHLVQPHEVYRYRLAHDALRNLARSQKFRAGGGA